MKTTIAAVDQLKLFDNIKKLKELLEKLAGLGISFDKLGELGKLISDAIGIITDPASTAAIKVNAVLTLFEKLAAATTGIAWDDKIAATLRGLEPLIVKLIGFVGIKSDVSASSSEAATISSVANESSAPAFNPMLLFSIVKMIWDVIQLFLAKPTPVPTP